MRKEGKAKEKVKERRSSPGPPPLRATRPRRLPRRLPRRSPLRHPRWPRARRRYVGPAGCRFPWDQPWPRQSSAANSTCAMADASYERRRPGNPFSNRKDSSLNPLRFKQQERINGRGNFFNRKVWIHVTTSQQATEPAIVYVQSYRGSPLIRPQERPLSSETGQNSDARRKTWT
eukprot:s2943_g5.t4